MAHGVYELDLLDLVIRIIVPRETAKTPRNALWHLLSADPELVRYGMEHYQSRDAELYNILNDLRETYAMEGLEVPYTKEDYKREVARELFQKMRPSERRELLQGLPPSERRELLQGLSPSERQELFQGLPLSERRKLLQGSPPSERRELLRGLPLEELEAYLKELRNQPPPRDDAATGQ